MDLQTYFTQTLAGKSIVVVGNAVFTLDYSQLIDRHNVVFRFNEFNDDSFQRGLKGRRIDFWFSTLGRTQEVRQWQDFHCDLVRRLNQNVVVGTPHEEDKFRRRSEAVSFFKDRGFEFIYPDAALRTSFLQKQPRTGFYTAYRLVELGFKLTVIGCTPDPKKWHDAEAEMEFYRNNPLIELHEKF